MTSIDKEKTERFLRGQCTPEERTEILHWLANDTSDLGSLQQYMQQAWDGKETPVTAEMDARVLSSLRAQLYQQEQPVAGKLHRFRKSWMRYAAAAILGGVILAIGFRQFGSHSESITASTPAETQVTATSRGQLKAVTLADGSQIWLNSASEIRYPIAFSGATREVYLEGEAFFDITPNTMQPFIIHTGKLNTTVLGTSFNIRSYAALQQVQVTVATGKVSVDAAGKTLGVLTPNQQLHYHTKDSSFRLEEVAASQTLAWRHDKIRLDGVSFNELAMEVKNTWGLSLQTKSDKLNKASYKTTFHRHDSINAVMKTIGKITNARYKIKDSTITMYE